jgi:FtsP/CotA-like multicopper oxidase with cupredoxin domain
VSNAFSAEPVLVTAYDAVRADGAAIWPDTNIPNTVTVPDQPPTIWNFTETLQDEGVSIFNEERGVAVYKFVKGDVVDVVLQNSRALNGAPELHSWHLHGHSFYVVGQGIGNYNPDDTSDALWWNVQNPVLRDTMSLWPNGWTAIRFKADNVGAWPFHCTMTPHSVMGMGFNVITSPDLLTAPPPGLVSCLKTSVDPAAAEV